MGALLAGERAMAKKPQRRWSGRVTRESHALSLERGVFAKRTPRAIALSLKRSAEGSRHFETRKLPARFETEFFVTSDYEFVPRRRA